MKNWQKTLDKVWYYRNSSGGRKQETRRCLPHDLFIVKLAAYDFKDSTPSLIYDCLSKRYQQVKIGLFFLFVP